MKKIGLDQLAATPLRLPRRLGPQAARLRARAEDIAERLSDTLGAKVRARGTTTARVERDRPCPDGMLDLVWPAPPDAVRMRIALTDEDANTLTAAIFGGDGLSDPALQTQILQDVLGSAVPSGEETETIAAEGPPLLETAYALEVDGDPVTIRVRLPSAAPGQGRAARGGIRLGMQAQLATVSLPLGRLAALGPGDRIALPGASLETAQLVARRSGRQVGIGEMGSDEGARSLRLMTVRD
ncbi:FliM/FliN family flagellar motor switch protein [Parvularcula oceani]|uniref:FliM/FliN family flagellar motor switch protein n=1 Tax=Parvularcula oceani TaxID=1247963 RepID=UPI0004E14E1C|nr:FliM/FliN family flagellar motor switch protein [Parvularcula oceani]